MKKEKRDRGERENEVLAKRYHISFSIIAIQGLLHRCNELVRKVTNYSSGISSNTSYARTHSNKVTDSLTTSQPLIKIITTLLMNYTNHSTHHKISKLSMLPLPNWARTSPDFHRVFINLFLCNSVSTIFIQYSNKYSF